jgi:hypothetical protein
MLNQADESSKALACVFRRQQSKITGTRMFPFESFGKGEQHSYPLLFSKRTKDVARLNIEQFAQNLPFQNRHIACFPAFVFLPMVHMQPGPKYELPRFFPTPCDDNESSGGQLHGEGEISSELLVFS